VLTLIVDGYNAIHSWSGLRDIVNSDLALARASLVHLMSEYSAREGVSVTVVFDAHFRKGHPELEVVDGVTVCFGTELQSADHVIERLAYEATRDGPAPDVIVVTGDRLQATLVTAMGVSTMSVQSLQEDVLRATTESSRAQQGKGEVSRFRRVEDTIDPETRARLERMRRGESD